MAVLQAKIRPLPNPSLLRRGVYNLFVLLLPLLQAEGDWEGEVHRNQVSLWKYPSRYQGCITKSKQTGCHQLHQLEKKQKIDSIPQPQLGCQAH
jgi:hypothetical protein